MTLAQGWLLKCRNLDPHNRVCYRPSTALAALGRYPQITDLHFECQNSCPSRVFVNLWETSPILVRNTRFPYETFRKLAAVLLIRPLYPSERNSRNF